MLSIGRGLAHAKHINNTYMSRFIMNSNNENSRLQELKAFLFLTVVLAPVIAIMLVGGYGFSVWISQMIFGPPGS